MPHDSLDLWELQPISSHGNKLLGPEFDKLTYLPCRHDDATNQCKLIVLQEIVLLQTLRSEHFGVMLQNARGVGSRRSKGSVCTLDFVGAEDNALAKEVGQDIVDANELKAPVKGVQNVGFLGHELVVIVRDADEVQ